MQGPTTVLKGRVLTSKIFTLKERQGSSPIRPYTDGRDNRRRAVQPREIRAIRRCRAWERASVGEMRCASDCLVDPRRPMAMGLVKTKKAKSRMLAYLTHLSATLEKLKRPKLFIALCSPSAIARTGVNHRLFKPSSLKRGGTRYLIAQVGGFFKGS